MNRDPSQSESFQPRIFFDWFTLKIWFESTRVEITPNEFELRT